MISSLDITYVSQNGAMSAQGKYQVCSNNYGQFVRSKTKCASLSHRSVTLHNYRTSSESTVTDPSCWIQWSRLDYHLTCVYISCCFN